MATTITKGATYYLETFLTDENGNEIAGLNVLYEIYRSSDHTLIKAGVLSNINGGVYRDGVVFLDPGQYLAIYKPPEKYPDTSESITVLDTVIAGKGVNSYTAGILRSLGIAGAAK